MLSIQARLLTPILEGEKPEFMDFETPPSLQGRQKFLSQRASCFETWPYCINKKLLCYAAIIITDVKLYKF